MCFRAQQVDLLKAEEFAHDAALARRDLAALSMPMLNLGYTSIVAPIDALSSTGTCAPGNSCRPARS